MNPKRMLAIAGVAALVGATMPAGSSGAATTFINGNGDVECSGIAGVLSFKPRLRHFGTATSQTIKVKATLAGCTIVGSTNGAQPVTGKLKATLQHSGPGADACSKITTGWDASGNGQVKWKGAKGSPRLNPSAISIDGITHSPSGDNPLYTATGSGSGGSFAGTDVVAEMRSGTTVFDHGLACSRKKGGRGLHFSDSDSCCTFAIKT